MLKNRLQHGCGRRRIEPARKHHARIACALSNAFDGALQCRDGGIDVLAVGAPASITPELDLEPRAIRARSDKLDLFSGSQFRHSAECAQS